MQLPRRRKRDTHDRVISRDDVLKRLLPTAPERYRGIVAVAAGTGLRRGEAGGVCLDAIDLGAGRLEIIRTVEEISGHTAFKAYPKSAAGRRTIPLLSWLIEIIAHHVAVYSPGVEQLVFPNTVGMPLRRTLFRARVWKPTLLRSGLDPALRFHDLRHCYATWFGRWRTDQHGAASLRPRTGRNDLDLYTRRSDGEDRILRALDPSNEADDEEAR